MSAPDLSVFQSWLGRREQSVEHLGPVPVQALAASLDLPSTSPEPIELPPLWHWLYFLDKTPSGQLAEDGSPRTSLLLPPIDLPQIMWAGSEIECLRPLRVGAPARKVSRILEMTGKQGSRGPMVFLTLEHRLEQDGLAAIVERTRAVFLGAARAAGSAAAFTPRPASHRREWPVDESLLFRFSALTFNTHRIHYDLNYATRIAGYPGLVVHGPLQALLLAETFREWMPAARVRQLNFRAKGPLYAGEPVVVCGMPAGRDTFELWTLSPRDDCAMACVVTYDIDG